MQPNAKRSRPAACTCMSNDLIFDFAVMVSHMRMKIKSFFTGGYAV